jgi:D-alanine-D-alanine ligase-like ATP-grasp enzyme
MDKALCKDLVARAGIPVLPYGVFSRQQIGNDLPSVIEAAEEISPYPLLSNLPTWVFGWDH